MRTQNNSEKVGEIFRKNLGKNNTDKEKRQSERRKNREKKRHREEKSSKKEEADSTKKKLTEQDSIITKQRITNKLGLYNKAKSSKTILRDQKVQDTTKKHCPDHEEELKKDLSRVLDCSSFRLNPLITSSTGYSNTEMAGSSDVPICVPRQISGRGSLNSSPRSIATVRSSVCGSAVSNCSQSSQGRLPFKTPLHEISENLIASLHPAETFNGRNYFMEVREQLLKVFKQSCARLNTEIKQGQVSSEVHKRCLKRKAAEVIPQASQVQTSEICVQRHDDNQNYYHDADRASTNIDDVMQPFEPETQQDTRHSRIHDQDNIDPTNTDNNEKSEFMLNKLYEDKESFNESYSFTNMEQLRSQRGKIHHEKSDSNYTSGFDIIDFIDHSSSEKKLTEKSPIPYDKRIREVSPPKKPTLDTPTPPRFYRRKMY